MIKSGYYLKKNSIDFVQKIADEIKKTEWKSLQRIIIEKLTNPELKK